MTSDRDTYDDGVAAGKILQRIEHHDRHFLDLNGSLAKLVILVAQLQMDLQRLADQASSREASSKADVAARDATVVQVAATLKDAEQARRDAAEQKWKPWQKVLAVVGGVAVVVGAVVAVLTLK